MEYLHGNDKISKQRVPEDQLQQSVGGVFDALDQDLCRFNQLVSQHEETHNQIIQLVILDQTGSCNQCQYSLVTVFLMEFPGR